MLIIQFDDLLLQKVIVLPFGANTHGECKDIIRQHAAEWILTYNCGPGQQLFYVDTGNGHIFSSLTNRVVADYNMYHVTLKESVDG